MLSVDFVEDVATPTRLPTRNGDEAALPSPDLGVGVQVISPSSLVPTAKVHIFKPLTPIYVFTFLLAGR